MTKCKCSIPDDNFYGICGACRKDLDVEENLWKIDMPKVEFVHSEQSCICPACGTEWVNGDPQKCSTVIRDEINTLESKLAKAMDALISIASLDYPDHEKESYWDKQSHYVCSEVLAKDTQIAREALKEIE